LTSFSYVAVDATGKKQTGVLEATSAVAARNELLGKSFEVLNVRERKSLLKIELTPKKIKRNDVMNFSRQLGAYLHAGIPILDALNALAADTQNPYLKRVLVTVYDSLRAGSSFADAVSQFGDIFPPYYVGILRSAELTGNLDVVLEQLSDYIERDVSVRSAIKSALTYPLVVLAMAAVTVTVLVTYVLPKFESFFRGLHAKLPLPTRMLLDFARFLEDWWPLLVGGFVAVVAGSFFYFRTERGRVTRDRLFLRMPAIGGVVQYAVIERFTRILGTMLNAGVPIPEALVASSEATNNRVYQQALTAVRGEVMRGEGLAQPLADTGLFPGAAAEMLKVGEHTGTLDRQLEVTANFYEVELQHRLKRLTSLFEPAIIIVMGVIVGFVAVALVSAMYGIFNQVKLK
jgi:type IV pilus assembly protein PilC